eukprot:TRINITY_DN19140_c0_g1_i2.p1 TRINITY_DN19140_c0_g1~~TRINITY_DN19140_c0_g1_i2.p1  ORF type:complete len:694 (+),score=142.15 TRINITY_DN19140_c0_g1_i2:55-2082(+)
MAHSEDQPDAKHDRALSLPQLQSLMKKDPEAYTAEFDQQWSHFESMMEIFKLKPQKPHSSFSEQVMFLSHVAPSFPSKAAKLPDLVIGALSEHDEVMHPTMRQALVQALILLRNRDVFPCIQALPLYFKLFRLQDKVLRKMIFTHVTKDIAQMHTKSKNQKRTTELVDFFFSRLKETDVEVARRSCAVFICLYRQNIWKAAREVNLMSAGLMHSDLKIAAALAHLFLGNKTKGLEGILDESDDELEDKEALEDAMRGVIVGSKKTGNRVKRVGRAKKSAKKVIHKQRKKDSDNAVISYVAIDMLHDPQTLAERLHQRVAKGSEPFAFRLLLLHLVARIVGRNQLELLNLYPFMMKYFQPNQKEVTKLLACFVEACHSQVPPNELRPTVLRIIHTFVNDAQASEVIEVGLNTIREVCVRAVNILEEDELADLVSFRRNKHKGVAMAARSLINAYREIHPQLLHRSLRGKEASMALSKDEVREPVFGTGQTNEHIEGLELLLKNDGEKKADSSKQLMTEQVISTEELRKLRKLKLQRSIEMQLGRKRKAVKIESNSSSESDSEAEESDGERGLAGRLPDAISGDQLKGTKAKPRTKQARVESAKSGFDFKEKIRDKVKARKGGKNNKEQARQKPQMMAVQSKKAKMKRNFGAKEKVRNLKKHISTLRTKCKTKRRRS